MEHQLLQIFEECNKECKSLPWFKIVFIGDSCVGKTSLIKAFCNAEFNPKYIPTVGVDYGFKVLNGIRLNMWDLSGNHFFKDTRNELYENTDLCILVYDVTSQQSFDSLDSYWLPEIIKYDIGDAVVGCIGNKKDKIPHSSSFNQSNISDGVSNSIQTHNGREKLTASSSIVKLSEVEKWCMKKGAIRGLGAVPGSGGMRHYQVSASNGGEDVHLAMEEFIKQRLKATGQIERFNSYKDGNTDACIRTSVGIQQTD